MNVDKVSVKICPAIGSCCASVYCNNSHVSIFFYIFWNELKRQNYFRNHKPAFTRARRRFAMSARYFSSLDARSSKTSLTLRRTVAASSLELAIWAITSLEIFKVTDKVVTTSLSSIAEAAILAAWRGLKIAMQCGIYHVTSHAQCPIRTNRPPCRQPVGKHCDDAGRQVLKLCQNMQIQFMVTGS